MSGDGIEAGTYSFSRRLLKKKKAYAFEGNACDGNIYASLFESEVSIFAMLV